MNLNPFALPFIPKSVAKENYLKKRDFLTNEEIHIEKALLKHQNATDLVNEVAYRVKNVPLYSSDQVKIEQVFMNTTELFGKNSGMDNFGTFKLTTFNPSNPSN